MMHAKNNSSAVLLSEITQFVKPGTRIILDALASHNKLQDMGYQHDFVIHKEAVVKTDESDVHTEYCNSESLDE
jgi:hypothetical protein